MMNYVYWDLIGRNVLVYIDDVIIYSETFEQYLQDLCEVFNTIRNSGLRLNTKSASLENTKSNIWDMLSQLKAHMLTPTRWRKSRTTRLLPQPRRPYPSSC